MPLIEEEAGEKGRRGEGGEGPPQSAISCKPAHLTPTQTHSSIQSERAEKGRGLTMVKYGKSGIKQPGSWKRRRLVQTTK